METSLAYDHRHARALSCALIVFSLVSPVLAHSPMSCLIPHELAHCYGWGAGHPGAIYTKQCGALPMPPPGVYRKTKAKIVIEYAPAGDVLMRCWGGQSCADIGADPCHVLLPR